MGELRSLRAENRRLNELVAPLQLNRDRLVARVLKLEQETKAATAPPVRPPVAPRRRSAPSIFGPDRYATEPHRE
jgi:hypothetical protein